MNARQEAFAHGYAAGDDRPLAQALAEAAAPAFFEPGRTYSWHGMWTFRCATVAAHPGTGVRTAVGWWRQGGGPWSVHEYTDAHWSAHWEDVTGAGEGP